MAELIVANLLASTAIWFAIISVFLLLFGGKALWSNYALHVGFGSLAISVLTIGNSNLLDSGDVEVQEEMAEIFRTVRTSHIDENLHTRYWALADSIDPDSADYLMNSGLVGAKYAVETWQSALLSSFAGAPTYTDGFQISQAAVDELETRENFDSDILLISNAASGGTIDGTEESMALTRTVIAEAVSASVGAQARMQVLSNSTWDWTPQEISYPNMGLTINSTPNLGFWALETEMPDAENILTQGIQSVSDGSSHEVWIGPLLPEHNSMESRDVLTAWANKHLASRESDGQVDVMDFSYGRLLESESITVLASIQTQDSLLYERLTIALLDKRAQLLTITTLGTVDEITTNAIGDNFESQISLLNSNESRQDKPISPP